MPFLANQIFIFAKGWINEKEKSMPEFRRRLFIHSLYWKEKGTGVKEGKNE